MYYEKGSDNLPGAAFGGRHDGRMLSVPGCGSVFRLSLIHILMVSMMLPQVLYIIPLYRLIFGMGLADTVLGVSLPLMVAPLAVFIMMQFIEDLPVSFIESAKIDGAGHFPVSYTHLDVYKRQESACADALLFA